MHQEFDCSLFYTDHEQIEEAVGCDVAMYADD